MIFHGHPLGHNILGTATNVRRFTTADALRFTHRHYRPANSIFFIEGDIDINKVVRQLQRADWPAFDTVSEDRKSTRLNSSHANISYAAFCLKKNRTGWPATA